MRSRLPAGPLNGIVRLLKHGGCRSRRGKALSRKRRGPAGRTPGALLLALLLTLCGAAALSHAAPASPPPGTLADFARDVRPILEERCWGCHGPQEQRGGLRLDTRAAALKGGSAGPALVPGNSAGSELVRRITSTDPKHAMPPGQPLSLAQIARLRAWIAAGAPFTAYGGVPSSSFLVPRSKPAVAKAGPATRSTSNEKLGTRNEKRAKQWSFQPVHRPQVPAVKNRAWVRNPVDAFILARLEQRGLQPSPPADPRTLIRRVTFDLTGLPPTPSEVEAFVRECAEERRSGPGRRTLGAPSGESAARAANGNGTSRPAQIPRRESSRGAGPGAPPPPEDSARAVPGWPAEPVP